MDRLGDRGLARQAAVNDGASAVLQPHVAVIAWAESGGVECAARVAEEVARQGVAGVILPRCRVRRRAAAFGEQAFLAIRTGDPKGVVDGNLGMLGESRNRDAGAAKDGAVGSGCLTPGASWKVSGKGQKLVRE